MEVADRIAAAPRNSMDRPKEPQVIAAIRVESHEPEIRRAL